jgi:hypothetical protein
MSSQRVGIDFPPLFGTDLASHWRRETRRTQYREAVKKLYELLQLQLAGDTFHLIVVQEIRDVLDQHSKTNAEAKMELNVDALMFAGPVGQPTVLQTRFQTITANRDVPGFPTKDDCNAIADVIAIVAQSWGLKTEIINQESKFDTCVLLDWSD